MRRRITLYIADQKVDLSDENLVLMNYALTDLTNPAVMRNSYSQTVTLPGTGTNDAVFSHYFRPDHTVAGGYDPLIRVPFTIYDDLGEILASGYCKLLRVTLEGLNHTYEVQLYGSLGEFIFGLAYDADGNKKTLASLDYLGGGDTELDFTIDAQAVADAWARLGGDTSKPAMWDVINFAPAYNGIPENFASDKAIAVPSDIDIPDTQDGGTYDAANTGGYGLFNLPKQFDEWKVKDLRSYLQRPVISVKAFLEAIANPANNGGWNVDISDIDSTSKWPYLKTWLTRPLLPSLGTYKQTSGGITATPSASATSGPDLVSIALADVPAGTDVTLRVSFGLQVNLASAAGQSTMYSWKSLLFPSEYRDVWFMQAVGYASDNSVVAASPVTIVGPNLSHVSDLAQFADDCTFVPVVPAGQSASYVVHSGFDSGSFIGSGTAFNSRGTFSLEMTGKNMASAKVIVKRGRILWKPILGSVTSVQNLTTFYKDTSSAGDPINEVSSLATGVAVTATTQSSSSLRSGALITKQMLLSTEKTPADYLVAICKTFGLYIVADSASKTAMIVRRDTFYQNETIDLTDRVDTSQPVELDPIAFDAKWYDFKHESVGGAFEEEYKMTQGKQYGIQRVNTGYDFDASVKNVLEGIVLKGAAAVRDTSKYWCRIERLTSDTSDINRVEPGTELSVTTLGEGISMYRPNNGIITSGYGSNWWIWYYPVTAGQKVLIYATNNASCGSGNSNLVGFATSTPAVGVPTTQVLGGSVLQGYKMVYTAPSNGYICIGQYSAGGQTLKVYNPVTKYYLPAVFLDTGNTYTLFSSAGDSLDTEIPLPNNSDTIIPMNGGMDDAGRAEFRNGENKPVDGADVLLFEETYFGIANFTNMEDFLLTDDIAEMDTLAGGPCWLFGYAATPLSVPVFSRYVIRSYFPDPLLPAVNDVYKSLDFGIPAQIDIPDLTYIGGTIFEKAWKDYIVDRLDKDVKVMRCRLRLDGLMVGPELLRKFFWYRGSIWVLNKIGNYSLTTFDLAECEFIQVRDTDAYLNGQY